MATTHTASPACPWLPECTLETTIMRGRRMRKNPSWIHHRWVGRDAAEGKTDTRRWGLWLKAGRDHHRFVVVWAVWRHIQYGTTVKYETTPRTSGPHGDGCKCCINKTRKSNQVHETQYFSRTFFLLLLFLASLPLSHLLRPRSSSPSIPPSLLLSSPFSLQRTDWMRAILKLLSQKSECRGGFCDLESSQKERERHVHEVRLWRQSPRDSCVKWYPWRWGVSYSVWERSDFIWGVCVYAGNTGSLMCGFVCVCEGSPVTHKVGCFWPLIDFKPILFHRCKSSAHSITCLKQSCTIYTWCLTLSVLFGESGFQPDSALIKAPKAIKSDSGKVSAYALWSSLCIWHVWQKSCQSQTTIVK